MTVVLGEKYKRAVTTKIKRPYTWSMTYKGSEVRGSIGDSGLAWNPEKATIEGKAAKVGSYDVVITLDNEASYEEMFYTLNIVPKELKITKPKSNAARFVFPEVKQGEVFSFQAEAQGSGPFTWSLDDVPDNYYWDGKQYSSSGSNWIKVDSKTGIIRADNVNAYGSGGFALDKNRNAYDFTLIVKDNYGNTQKLPVRLPVKIVKEAPKFREDKRYVNAEYNGSTSTYNFIIPLAISGSPRGFEDVEWKVEGGEKFGITSENMRHDFYEHYDISGNYWTKKQVSHYSSWDWYIFKNGEDTGWPVSYADNNDFYMDDGTYRYYYLNVNYLDNLDKTIYDQLSNHKLILKITADNGAGKATATAEITFPAYNSVVNATFSPTELNESGIVSEAVFTK